MAEKEKVDDVALGYANLQSQDDSLASNTLTPEQERFEKRSPLATLGIFAVGPLMFNTGISFHDAVDLFLISLKFKDGRSLQIVGFASLVRYLCLCVAIFYSQALITKIGNLMGQKRLRDAEQVVADIFRLGILTMLVVPVFFYFISKPMLIFMGCEEPEAAEGEAYLVPLLIGMPFITIFQLCCGFLQSEGRSVLCGAMQILGFALNCGCFAPIMLFGLNIELKWAGVSFVIAQGMIGIVLIFFIFGGKFGLKPKWSMWLNGFTKEAFHGMLVALPFLINVLAQNLPAMLLLREMMVAAKNAGIADSVGAVFPCFIKLNSAVNSVSIGFCQGFLGAGSYANGARNFNRLRSLFGVVCAITFFYHLVLMPLLVFKTEVPCSLWLTDSKYIEVAKRLVRVPFYTNTLVGLNFAIVNFLLTMKRAFTALILTVTRGCLYVVYTYILFYTDKSNPYRMMHAYNMDDATLFVLGLCLIAKPLREVLDLARQQRQIISTNPLLSLNSTKL